LTTISGVWERLGEAEPLTDIDGLGERWTDMDEPGLDAGLTWNVGRGILELLALRRIVWMAPGVAGVVGGLAPRVEGEVDMADGERALCIRDV
jgi:hypothetical protein